MAGPTLRAGVGCFKAAGHPLQFALAVLVKRKTFIPERATPKCCLRGRFSLATKALSPGYRAINVVMMSATSELGGTPSSIFALPSQAACNVLGMITVMFIECAAGAWHGPPPGS